MNDLEEKLQSMKCKNELLMEELDVLDRSHADLAHRLADAGREIERLQMKLRRIDEIVRGTNVVSMIR